MMNTVEIMECADDAALVRALEAGHGWIVGLTRQPDGALEDAMVVRNAASGFLAVFRVGDVDRIARGLPSNVAGAMRDAAARIRTEIAE